MAAISPALEAEFGNVFRDQRIRFVNSWAAVGTIVYCCLLFGDNTMMPELGRAFAFGRLGIFVPLMILSLLILRFYPRPLVYDVLAVLIGAAADFVPLSVAVQTTGPNLFSYQTGGVASLLFFVVALRPRFPAALAGLAVICCGHFYLLTLNTTIDRATFGGIISFYLTVSAFLIVSAYFSEHTERLNFLNGLRAAQAAE